MNLKTTIKSLSDDDRPREKLISKGSASLSTAELMAILIGSGNLDQNAVELSRSILSDQNNDLIRLSRLTLEELMQYKGIGQAKAVSIVAALELGKRRLLAQSSEKPKIQNSNDAYEILRPYMMDLGYEEFWVLMLSRSNQVIHQQKFSQGGTTGTVVDLKLIIKSALLNNAQSIVLSHNHPSGNIKPSAEDKNLTEKVKNAAHLVDIKLLDHLIISDSDYFSFADQGIL